MRYLGLGVLCLIVAEAFAPALTQPVLAQEQIGAPTREQIRAAERARHRSWREMPREQALEAERCYVHPDDKCKPLADPVDM